jgi:hypothetical protein
MFTSPPHHPLTSMDHASRSTYMPFKRSHRIAEPRLLSNIVSQVSCGLRLFVLLSALSIPASLAGIQTTLLPCCYNCAVTVLQTCYYCRIEELGLLSKVEELGLLSKLESSGLTLSQIEKSGLLSKAEKAGILTLVADK